MSKELDNLFNNLLQEISDQEKRLPASQPQKPTEESLHQAEQIAYNVEQDTSWHIPPEEPKPEIPEPPAHDPVVVPPPVSHFTDVPSQNPAVRMRDRLDETSLPKPDAERKPTQIMETKPKRKKKKSANASGKSASASKPAPPKQEETKPKRKIPHIVIPDELPPDVPREIPKKETSAQVAVQNPERQEVVRSRAEQIREQLRRRAEEAQKEEETAPEETASKPKKPVIPEEKPEEQDDVLLTEEEPEEDTAEAAEEDTAEEETEEKPSFFENLRRRLAELFSGEDDEDDDEEEDEAEEEADTEDKEDTEGEADTEEVSDEEGEKPSFFGNLRSQMTGLFSDNVEEDEETEEDEEVSSEEEAIEEEASEPISVSKPEASARPESAVQDKSSRLRHLSEPEEVPSAKPTMFGRFRQKKEKAAQEDGEQDDDSSQPATDWRTLAPPPAPEPVEEAEEQEESEQTETETEPEDMKPAELEKIEQAESESIADTEKILPDAPPMPLQPPPMPEQEIAPLPLPPQPPAKRTLGSMLREAFDESAEELAEMKAEPLPVRSEEPRTHFLKRHSYFLAGIVCSLLALVGLVSCIRWGWSGVRSFAGGASLKQKLEDVLYPVAVVDLPAFESAGELESGSLLSAAMVHILMYDDLSQYPDNFEVLSIPASDVLARAQILFGTDFQPEFTTLHAAGETFYYDNESGCYNVPASPVIFSYAPEVSHISRSGDTYVTTVKYHSDTASWQERSGNFDSGSDKTMEITLQKNGNSFQIMRIVNIQTGNGE